ncbi:hypothetical protein [Fulvimarina sp. MAC3]|uniref:hypothetical protein n=1 Tax=Fulvimarina sp. MAC3 TaxID=3148887 RepID=UPI0031FD4C06
MDHRKLAAALQEAADAYAASRRLASHLPLEAAQIDFLVLNSGISNAGLKLCRRERNARRTRFSRDEFDPASLDYLVKAFPASERMDLAARLSREIATLKRYARISDARYDINRHAALVRLLAALNGRATDGPRPPLDRTANRKGVPPKRNAFVCRLEKNSVNAARRRVKSVSDVGGGSLASIDGVADIRANTTNRIGACAEREECRSENEGGSDFGSHVNTLRER